MSFWCHRLDQNTNGPPSRPHGSDSPAVLSHNMCTTSGIFYYSVSENFYVHTFILQLWFFKVIKKGYMCISNNRTKHGFHVFLLILSRDARSGIMISSLGSKCQHFKVGMPVFQPFYDMKLKTCKFKVLAFWIQWRYHHQIQITRSSYHELRTPRESFFSKIWNFWAWADKLGRNFMRHLGYFWPNYKHYFGTVSS